MNTNTLLIAGDFIAVQNEVTVLEDELMEWDGVDEHTDGDGEPPSLLGML